MSIICNSCDGTGCSPYGPHPAESRTMICRTCGGSGGREFDPSIDDEEMADDYE